MQKNCFRWRCAGVVIVSAAGLLALLVALFDGQMPVQAAEGARTMPAAQEPAVVSETVTAALLSINEHLLINQPGAHLGPPQMSPDGALVAVVVVPTGNETAHLARTYLFDTASGDALGDWPGHSPHWTAATSLSWRTRAEIIEYDVGSGLMVRTASNEPLEADPALAAGFDAGANPAYPQTIRVLHHASNGCRNVPAGQVDVIPFEEYVARVVPAEAPSFWEFDALAAQAVAARTYAWRQILVGRPTYDVTDWANFQVMCDDRYPRTDAATAATAGVYLSELGDEGHHPILAMYSAENGHPTLTNPNASYLRAVPDLFSLGRVRFGHGYGLSQWGAQRRARAGHNYRQILGHYYSEVYLQNAQKPTSSLSALTAPAVGDWLTTGALRWQVLSPSPTSPISLSLTSTMGAISPTVLMDANGVWRSQVALTDGLALTAQLWAGGEPTNEITVIVDGTAPPSPNVIAPAVITEANLPLTVNAEVGDRVGFHAGWSWQGETLFHTADSGALVADLAAADGLAWQAQAGVHRTGVWYGPYTPVLAAGQSYRALFWLRAGIPAGQDAEVSQPATPLARLDVTDRGGEVQLGLRELWASDFAGATAYQPVAVDFHVFGEPEGLEFRVFWPGAVDLALDRVEVWTLPDERWRGEQPLSWPLPAGAGPQQVAVAAFDPAGNVSPATLVTTVVDLAPPMLILTQTVVATDLVQLAWLAFDDATGVAAVEIELLTEGDWSQHPGSPFGSEGAVSLELADESIWQVRLRARDGAGRVSAWQERMLFIAGHNLYLPLVSFE
jgi:hypothetical protein